ncbi:MAG: monovalent cation:proton antiporter-2 (CPA2) family protein [Gammaproteobacteria bacterium]
MSLIQQIAIFLAAAVLMVPLFKRLGLGAVLGYLVAGVLIGPSGFGVISDVTAIYHFSEFGVVLLLFIIGLELQPSRLWVLRRSVFGLGSAQVLITGGVLAVAGVAFGLEAKAAIIAGLGLSLSSTAFVLQILAEKNQLTTRHGRESFAILLFQDLAVIPLLALLPLLGVTEAQAAPANMWLSMAQALLVIVVVIAGGRLLLRPVFKAVAASRSQEIFTAAALLVVIATALLMELAGLSMALGAFLAGVLLADSEYRHALEADLDPFKGLLLGLFFIAVGMSANLGLIGAHPMQVMGLVLGLMSVKFLVLFVLGTFSGAGTDSARHLGIALAQGGEFAFVLFSVATSYQVMTSALSELLVVVVSLSMAATPLLFALNEKVIAKWLTQETPPEYDRIVEPENKVIIAGFGRFGQIVARVLRTRKIAFTAMEASPAQVDFVRRFGNKIYYGDASRLDLLRAAHAEKAEIFVLAIDDIEASLKTAETVRRHFPKLAVYARARNRYHAYKLMDLGAKLVSRETFLSSLDLARQVLQGLGVSATDASRSVAMFRKHDEALLVHQRAIYNDEAALIQSVKQAAEELEGLFESDAQDKRNTAAA